MPPHNTILLRKGSHSEWLSSNAILASGEPGFDTTNSILKIGDGENSWSNLPIIGLEHQGLSNYLVKWNNDVLSTGIIYDNGQYIGIGTNSPTVQLHVDGSGFFRDGLTVSDYTFPTIDGLEDQYLQTDGAGNLSWVTIAGDASVEGTGISGYLSKWNSSNIITSGIIYDNGNNIGIGTSFPLAKLHIRNPNTFQNPNVIIHDSSDLAAGVGASIILGGKFNTAGSYGDFAEIKSIKESSANNNASASLAFFTTNIADLNERMRITSSGSVGIGVSTPLARLHVDGNGIFASGLNISNQTASTIASFDSNKNIVSLPTSTYPSLTELSHIKGLTSNAQTQINGKVTSNTSIAGATKTKITYDSKGLVTTGSDLTESDIPSLSQNKITNLVTDLSDRTTKTYISSRGENLLTNGTALLGDNTNFSAFTFDGSNANSSPGSFRFIGPGTVYTDEFMPVLAEKRYKMSVDAKTLNGIGRYFMMTVAFDVDNQVIGANHHMYRANTLTTLASELKNGDTVVYLTSAANWDNSGTAGVSTHLRSIILWNYTNSFGYTYPPLTYSRNWFGNAWDPGSIDFANNTITLRVPWAGGTVPAGTQLSNGSSGGSFKYNILSNTLLTTSWTTYTGFMDGIDYSGTNVTTKFPPGTAKIKLGWLMNYAGTGETAWFTNMTVGLDDNAYTATTLQTSRNINGTSFNGSADITTSSWGTARNVTIGNTTRSVNGSTNYSWTLSDIGAQATLTNPVTGTGTSNFLPKWSSTNNLTNSILYDDGANIGIGTSQPSQKLHVNGNTASQIFLAHSSYGWSQAPSFSFIDDPDTGWYYESFNSGAVKFLSTSIDGELVERVYKDGHQFKNKNIFITSDSSSSCGIYIQGSGTDELKILTTPWDCSIGTTFGGPLNIQTYGGYNTGAQTRFGLGTVTSPSIVFYDGGNLIADDDTGFWHPATNNLAISTAGLERLRIDSNGNVGIGTNTPAAKLHIAGDTLFENLSYRRFTTSTAIATHFRKYYDIAHYANSVSTVAGSLRIEIPVTTSTMWSMDVVIVEYDGVNGNNIKTTNLTITGYTTTNLNRGVWTNNPSRINQVRFGRKSGGGSTIILIDPTSTFRYPKAYIKEINTHHSNETTFSNSANYSITITSDETDFILNGTITNDQFIRDDKLVNTFGNQTVSGNKTFDGNVIINETGGNFDFRVEGDTDQYLLFTDASVDRVAIGTASMNGKFNVTDSSTNTSNRYLNYFYGSHTSSANGAYYVFGDNINVYKLVNSGITDTGYAMGSEIVSVLNGNGTLTSTYGLRTYAGIHTGSSAGTNTAAYGVQSRVINFGSGSSLIGEARGVDIYINGDLGNNKTSAGITTAKALNIGTILDATNKWAIYQEGADDKNYLNGSVGIGTSPASKLHVLSAKDAAYGNFFIQDSTASAAGVGASIIFGGKYTSGGAYARFGEIKAIKENSTDGNYDSALVFSTNDMSTLGERVRIDHNGNVGIGTPSPLYKLDVNGTFSANSVNVNNEYTFPTIDGSSGQALVTNGSGVVSWSDIASANLTRGSFEVTSTQSTFTVSGGYTLNTLSVYYNGVKLLLGTDFTATNGTTFTLTNAAVNGDIVEYWALNSASSAVGNTSTGSVSVTSNQTVFNVTNGYTVGGLVVFVNGVKLVDGVDFTATNGSSFTLTSAATSGDVVDYVAYGAVVASSNLQKTGDTMTGNLTIGNGSDLIVEGDLIVAKYKEGFVNIGNAGSTQTIDISNGTLQTCILNSSCTFTMPTAEAGRSFTLLLKTGTGSFTSTFTNVKWPNDTAPTITTTANKMDILTFVSDGVNWYGNISQNYSV